MAAFVPGGADLPHGAEHVVTPQGLLEFAGAKLTAPVGVECATGDRVTGKRPSYAGNTPMTSRCGCATKVSIRLSISPNDT
ncbi:hypothetical protein DSM43518_03536 [Mycobacterium marinum]|nr:hypothetical protein MM1218R_03535 [Mycobacterium marinum]QYL29313.1 hypothetical protein TM48_03768 [Mycobacterium shottsii]RFZ07068.1 hypothetical protein DSM43518_03536 [Mycobacterium marinum]RFZ08562.1 hypothetical protein VIMS_04136 [Mycobacterium marinum]RFZ19361.1 hypothetical protein DSM43519_04032 [Mycobacterium marinum]